MKSNQKARIGDDEAVSPVIAVILMVAITVVLAATVYVWVSGFSGKDTRPAAALSFSRSAAGGMATFTVTSVSPGVAWSSLKILTDATTYSIVSSAGDVSAWSTGLQPASTAMINAGDKVYVTNGAASAVSAKITVVDILSNNVIATQPYSLDAGASADPTLSVNRVSGTVGAGPYTAGVLRFSFSTPIDMATLVIGDLAVNNGHVLTDSTLTRTSPTTFTLTGGAGTTLAGGDTITIALGNVNNARGDATSGAITVVLPASI